MKKLLLVILLLAAVFCAYTSFLIGVEKQTKSYLQELKKELKAQGYSSNFIVVSGKRLQLHNTLLNKFGGAASKSKHLTGQAIDILVLDINRDGNRNSMDVDIVYSILDKIVIGNQGGIGTYKNESGFFNRQMVHLDNRGHRARWHR